MDGKNKKKLSFRTQLILYGVLLVAIVALPVLYVEVQKPWQLLQQMIDQSKIVIVEVKTNFSEEELARMNQFALAMNEQADPEQEDYLIWAFNIYVIEKRLLTEEEMLTVFQEQEEELEDFDYTQVKQSYAFWQEQFAVHDNIDSLFIRYKQALLEAREASMEAGFEYDDVYIMTDNQEVLTFLIDGGSWWESTYPGLEYDVEDNECPEFRGYLQNGPGFASNPIHYHYKIFPKFDSDKWGDWFTVWLAEENQGIYNNFAMDFKADRVKDLMWTLGIIIIISALLVLLIILFIAMLLSRRISAPIKDLIVGIEKITQGDYDVQVKKTGSQEFEKLIEFFNKMVVSLKERLNMKQTLEKLLSEELAEQVAKKGLVLGGQNVQTTIMFTDFAGFSTITQGMEPKNVVQMLNDYFHVLTPIIKKWGGFTDKFIGDAIVAIFGAPVPLANHAENAVCCAIEMQLAMRQLNKQRQKENKPVLEMRIGLNSGEVLAGAIGSDLKLEYTSIGETTNLANRMEANCQIGHVLIAEATFKLVQGIFFNGVDFDEDPNPVIAKGYAEPVHAYNIYVSEWQIDKMTKETESKDQGFYHYVKRADRHLKFADQMEPAKLAKFKKIVRLNI